MSKRRRVREKERRRKKEEEEERRLGRNLWKGREWDQEGGRGAGATAPVLCCYKCNVLLGWKFCSSGSFWGDGGDGWQGEYGGTCKREFKMNGVERNGKEEWTF